MTQHKKRCKCREGTENNLKLDSFYKMMRLIKLSESCVTEGVVRIIIFPDIIFHHSKISYEGRSLFQLSKLNEK